MKKNGLRSLGELTYLRSYSKDGKENYGQTVERYLDFWRKRFPGLVNQINGYGELLHSKQVVGSMRLYQFSGKAVDDTEVRAYNCVFISPTLFKDYADICYLLCSGAGVGASVESHYVNRLPDIPEGFEQEFVIPDDKEGWADSFELLLKNRKIKFVYDLIRPAGAKLSSGGTASGPGPLMKAHERIRQVIGDKVRLTSEDDADIICLIAQAVVSGGSRRSAVIILSDVHDELMKNYKAGDWWNTNQHRAKANISSVAKRFTDEVVFALNEQLDSPFGERGVVLVDERNYDENIGTNPCQPEFAPVITKFGPAHMRDVEEGIELWDGRKFVKVLKKWSSGVKDVFGYTTGVGLVLATENHRVMSNGVKVELKNAKSIDDETGKAWPILNRYSLGRHEVFDITVDSDEHVYMSGGHVVSNCGEISLKNRQLCNLSEVIVSNCSSEEDFFSACRAASFFGTLQASLTNFKYIHPDFEKNSKEDALLGVSLTGQAQAGSWFTEDCQTIGADIVVRTNQTTARKIGINPAKRCTTTKPSGSTSCVMSTTSGVHAAAFEYGVRRIRVTKLSPLGIELVARYGISDGVEVDTPYGKNILPVDKYAFIVPEAYDDKDIVLQFAAHYENAIYLKNEGAIALLERCKKLYHSWILPGHVGGQETSNISLTVAFHPHEKEAIKEWALSNQDSYRAISTLPHVCGYELLPFEELSKEEYDKYFERFPDIDLTSLGVSSEAHSTSSCSGGGCEIT